MRAWITLDMDDGDLREAYAYAGPGLDLADLADSLRARLSEVYVGNASDEVRGEVVAVRLRRPDGVLVEPHPNGYAVPR